MSEPKPKTRSRRKRGCLRLLAIFAVLAGCIAAFVWTGYPQRWAVERLATAGLGTEVDVGSISLGRAVQVRGLRVWSTDGSAEWLTADSIEVRPFWPPWGPRLLDRVTVDRPVLTISGENSSRLFQDFFVDEEGNQRSSSNPVWLLPEHIEVTSIQLASYRPGLNLDFVGLDLEAQLRSPESWEIQISGTHARAAWTTWDAANPMEAAGGVDIRVRRDGGELLAESDANVPNLLQLAANVRIDLRDEGAAFDFDVQELKLHQAAIGLFPSGVLPVETGFEQIDLSGSRVTGELSGGVPHVREARILAAATGLRLGHPAAPYFAGDVSVEGSGNADKLELLAAFGAGQQAHIAYGVVEDTGAIDVSLEGWTRDQIRGVAPAAYHGALDAIPGVKSVSGGARIQLDDPSAFESTLTVALDGKNEAQLAVRGIYNSNLTGIPIAGSASLFYAEGTAVLETVPGDGDALTLSGKLDNVRVEPWLAAISPSLAPIPFGGTMSGSVQLRKTQNEWQSQVNLTLDAPRLGGMAFADEAFGLAGDAAVDAALERATGTTLNVTAGDGLEWTLRDWSLQFRDMQARARLTGGGDITALASTFGLPALSGTVEVDGDAAYAGGAVVLRGKLHTEDLGYGAFAVPYGQALEVAFDGEYRAAEGRVHAKELQLSLGEGNRVSGKNVELDLSSLTMKAPEFQCVTDLSPLVAFEYLAEAQGKAEITGTLDYGAGGLRGVLHGQCSAARLSHAATGALLEGVGLNADLTIADTPSGNGTLKLDALTIAGVVVSALETGLHVEAASLRTDTVQTRVFDGDLEAEVTVGLLDPGVPIRLALRPRNVDLAVFTEQVKPPDVRMTGRASGEIIIEFAGGILRDLELDLEAPDGFSMNRDMVEWLLLTQYAQDLPMGQSMEKILRDILGKGEQREFQSAKMALGFVDGRIAGQAVLESESLALTVDITADPKALTEALRARQRQP